ncbi:S-(-)-azetidine-2-carboxylate hydrolase [Pseudomonas reidholzensis]|uniref:S-(-)-azetidine-2-carboxylate hydrolase n=1 Tax=Pseudomonas reidholzensis TaxID=1785162 RepID=A0A383RUC2_9PSED|nr:haloacid dehalogenase type II [Pseudomonas reidholzensis]SYX90264.1 S-(-)-azetidine-2-carboxylate hydrolase [Pseudomonas reidholzensis]
MQLTDFKALTFDCYGTLIDWETGIVNALQPLAKRTGKTFTSDELLEVFGRNESPQQTETPGALYQDILRAVYDRIAKEWGLEADAAEREEFGTSVKNWPAFPDTVEALQYLKKHYKLVILSNIDRNEFKLSNAKLGVEFDHIITAQDVGSYKPNPNNFTYMIDALAKVGIEQQAILHTAESLYHDHIPANDAGLVSAWIYRRHGKEGYGATHVPSRMPHVDFRFNSMGEMAEAHKQALKG